MPLRTRVPVHLLTEVRYHASRYHDKLANFFDQKLVMLEQEKREITSQLNRNLVDFRAEYQKKEYRREFDISDPALLKNSLPARVGDEDSRNTVSGAQVFEAERCRWTSIPRFLS